MVWRSHLTDREAIWVVRRGLKQSRHVLLVRERSFSQEEVRVSQTLKPEVLLVHLNFKSCLSLIRWTAYRATMRESFCRISSKHEPTRVSFSEQVLLLPLLKPPHRFTQVTQPLLLDPEEWSRRIRTLSPRARLIIKFDPRPHHIFDAYYTLITI